MAKILAKKRTRATGETKLKKKSEIILPPVDWKTYRPGPIVGVDEVGRGCLAGPVYAAAVSLKSDLICEHFTDSKLVSEKRREELFPLIEEHHWVALGFATVEEIDELNILQASLLAMHRAVLALEIKMQKKTGHLLVDGNMKVPDLICKQTTLIQGDLRCSPISAASIYAKVARDRLMRQIGKEFPQYGFEKHKGYASVIHRKAIQEAGPCSHHRKSFSGVKEFLPRAGF